ncbi:MAG: hypothetical protein SWK76_01195 [Actinomycetota bacterium]|nr:hypothetical protein [Actinomycetota bacterium]
MRKCFAMVFIALMVAGFMVIAGCGDEGGGEISVNQPVEEGIVGTFESSDDLEITFDADGTFTTDAWGVDGEGTYWTERSTEGVEVMLNFEDGAKETLSVAISNGEVTAVLDSDGNQFTKK